MKIKFTLFYFILVIIWSYNLIAQIKTDSIELKDYKERTRIKLDSTDLKDFRERTIIKINEFQDCLAQIASKNLSYQTKKFYINATLPLFIDTGKKVTMEVVKVLNNKILDSKSYYLPHYLDTIAKLKYGRVELKRIKSCIVSNPYQKGVDSNNNPIFAAVATYYQEFTGFADNKIVYHDITQKTVEIEISLKISVNRAKWDIKLGDVNVARVQ